MSTLQLPFLAPILATIVTLAQITDDDALKRAAAVIAQEPTNATHWLARAEIHARLGHHEEAIADFAETLARDDRRAAAYDGRGNEHLKLGHIEKALSDFDEAIRLEPRRAAGHWQRGIALCYAQRYEDGAEQFAAYQTVDDNDVENAVWRMMCQARGSDLATARRSLLKVRRDARVPMMELYALFAGQGTLEQVLRAADAGQPSDDERNRRQFYAHLYLGLYLDVTGDAAAAQKHLETAVEQHRVGDYMWDVGRVHLERLRSAKAKSR